MPPDQSLSEFYFELPKDVLFDSHRPLHKFKALHSGLSPVVSLANYCLRLGRFPCYSARHVIELQPEEQRTHALLSVLRTSVFWRREARNLGI
jgi:hypothetical protein